MNDIKNIIGKRIKILRRNQDLTQKQLAEMLKVSQQTVGYWETGDRLLKADQIKMLANYFNVSTDYLLGLSSVPTTNKNLQYICDYIGLDVTSVITLHVMNARIPADTERKFLNCINAMIREWGDANE